MSSDNKPKCFKCGGRLSGAGGELSPYCINPKCEMSFPKSAQPAPVAASEKRDSFVSCPECREPIPMCCCPAPEHDSQCEAGRPDAAPRKVLDKAWFDEQKRIHNQHTCDGKECECKCGRGYYDGKAVIAKNGMRSPDCRCAWGKQQFQTPPSGVAQPEAPATPVEIAPEGWEDGSQLGGPPVRAGNEQLAVVQAPQFNEYDIAAMIYAREVEPTRGAEYIRAYARQRDAAKDAHCCCDAKFELAAMREHFTELGFVEEHISASEIQYHNKAAEERDAQIAALTKRVDAEKLRADGYDAQLGTPAQSSRQQEKMPNRNDRMTTIVTFFIGFFCGALFVRVVEAVIRAIYAG